MKNKKQKEMIVGDLYSISGDASVKLYFGDKLIAESRCLRLFHSILGKLIEKEEQKKNFLVTDTVPQKECEKTELEKQMDKIRNQPFRTDPLPLDVTHPWRKGFGGGEMKIVC